MFYSPESPTSVWIQLLMAWLLPAPSMGASTKPRDSRVWDGVVFTISRSCAFRGRGACHSRWKSRRGARVLSTCPNRSSCITHTHTPENSPTGSHHGKPNTQGSNQLLAPVPAPPGASLIPRISPNPRFSSLLLLPEIKQRTGSQEQHLPGLSQASRT